MERRAIDLDLYIDAREGPTVSRGASRTGQPIRVIVADQQPLLRRGVAMLLASEPDVEVVAEAAGGDDVVEAARRWQPDLVVIDGLPAGNLEVIRTVTAEGFATDPHHPVRVLVLTDVPVDPTVYRALRAGASGLLLKDTAPHELLRAIRVVAAGNGWLDPAVTRQLIRDFAAHTRYPS